MARVARRIIERRRIQMLLYMVQHAGDDGLTRVSNSEMAVDLDLSVEQVRNACRSLAGDGLLESHPQYLYNGAQVENAYCLTHSGRQLLAAYLEGARTPAAAIRA